MDAIAMLCRMPHVHLEGQIRHGDYLHHEDAVFVVEQLMEEYEQKGSPAGKSERMKCYLYDVTTSDGKSFATIFANDVPQQGERVSVWVNDDFKFYKVKSRIFGVNVPEEWSVWNLYLQPISAEEFKEEAV